jgi:hypothetical protein
MNAFTWFDDSVMASLKSGWLERSDFHKNGQSKRFKAVLKVHEKMARSESDPFQTLPTVTFFAPFINHSGEVMRHPFTGVFVYLCPNLEFESQPRVNFVVAHELAHVALGHHHPENEQMKLDAETHEDRPAEKAADELAAQWGFAEPKRRRSRFVQMVGREAKRRRAKATA